MTTANAYVLGEHVVIVDSRRVAELSIEGRFSRSPRHHEPNGASARGRVGRYGFTRASGRETDMALNAVSPEGDRSRALRVDVRGVVDDSLTATNGNRVEYASDALARCRRGGNRDGRHGDGTVWTPPSYLTRRRSRGFQSIDVLR